MANVRKTNRETQTAQPRAAIVIRSEFRCMDGTVIAMRSIANYNGKPVAAIRGNVRMGSF